MLFRNILPKTKGLPYFLVIGAQKSGTTSLHRIMMEHPELYLPSCKEVQYFTLNSNKPKSWYEWHYKNAKWGQKKGDITPFYLFHPEAASRIHSLLPKTKIITLLRDPVERTLSQYFHAKRHGFENLNLKDALEAEDRRLAKGGMYSLQKHSYVSRSKYIEQLDRYESLFPPKQMLIIKSENFFEKTEVEWAKIQKFLKISQRTLTKTLPVANSGEREARNVEPEIRKTLMKKLKSTTEETEKRYGISWNWQDK